MSEDDLADGRSPYILQQDDDEMRYAFWADTVADQVEARVADQHPDEDEPEIVIKGGISPSGVPHLGNVNEILRGYFVAAVLRERGHEVRQVFTADDRDPLRKLPRTLCDLDGNLVDLGDVDAGALGRNLGHPYTDIPDPFGCCDSYGDHFSTIIQDSADAVDVPIDMVSTTDLYTDGTFDDVTRHALANRDRAREVLAEYQDKVDEEYIPFNPICEECGKVTETVTDVTLEPEESDLPTVDYRCTDMDAGDRTIDGCGHEGTATIREGKMPWRFEWPGQWGVLGVDFEPFGKDHAEGSWPSGDDVARNVLDIEPPVPMVYEWFTLDGEPFSSSEGNVILVSDVLELLEPEVLRYFFAKDPSRARDFSIERLDQLVDEFDRFEATYFGEVAEATEDEQAFADRVYPLVVEEVREERIRLPYTFAAVLGMTDDPDLREEIARREGHIPDDAPEWAVEQALARVERARNWARRTENEFDYELKRTEIPDHEFDAETEDALAELADFIEAGHDPEEIQGEIYETAKRNDIDTGEFFGAGYRLFFDEEQGPKLGPFLAKVDQEFVVARLRRER
ncbi:lysine--tRNA ligase [Natrialba magadii ATCC 43099]|uniref:Lysine--tRNA ligase n=1 Tax=Natrialba magadii (strain ATCC 43099 / DSM 3394 / CCM 3739 / CIP 104546 / IAM 13178 / JCM 8861 / NBRC 102185 / NCIMB 2190 / MS3) TaxID=547559 RepID=D3STR8_NATMM|nr:lysine--tRNA ligase [Natrialba magadii]ADD05085.1 lysine--tRNA ligase [Natrialba magadii ATCC 43099]ELY23320.1 lysyl-tRNA ligase [Natrialba magadii ATCC 43099]